MRALWPRWRTMPHLRWAMSKRVLWIAAALIVAVVWLLSGLIVRAQQPVNVAAVNGSTPVSAICDDPAKVTSANINLGAGTGNTEIVALSGSTIITVCDYFIQVGGADGTQWIMGTGSACATGETDKQTFK